jgi:UDP-2,4-diacetamido-2,4,6-trideoxy-beta-L-altropyranose hydrolase
MNPETLLIRADASIAIGTGHVMRCLALAQAWQDAGGRVIFAAVEMTEAMRQRLLSEGCEFTWLSGDAGGDIDARNLIVTALESRAAWIVVDGYRFDAEYQRKLKREGLKVLFLDDYGHGRQYSADLVLNQNLGASENLYRDREPYTKLLLGTQYCILRREFRGRCEWQRAIPSTSQKILVTVGGTDPGNVTLQVIHALEGVTLDWMDIVVVLGGSNPHHVSIQQAALLSRHSVRIVRDVVNMAEWMAWADLAISGAGSTCWEICALGLPSLLLCVAENQKMTAERLAQQGAARLLDMRSAVTAPVIVGAIEELACSAALRDQICRTARELVDCNGACRVVSAMNAWALQ